MLDLEEARSRILRRIPTLPSESVRLEAALHRVAAEDVSSPLDLPSFDNSAMDGYAVRADDLQSATGQSPVSLRVQGEAAAGESFAESLVAGACVRIFTGSPLPSGADAVVMQEDTQPDPRRSDCILFPVRAKPWENVRLRGEDVKKGSELLAIGDRIKPGHLALLAASGVPEIMAGKRPRVGLLATGSELREPAEVLGPGQIHESNRLTLAALLRTIGLEATVFPLLPDSLAATQRGLEEAFSRCDAVITSGGVSVGEHDFVKEAFRQIGGSLELWRVAIKPGKPFVFGLYNDRPLFGLPGNPVSAFVTCFLLVKPALEAMQGARNPRFKTSMGRLEETLANPGDRRHFMRVTQDSSGAVRSAGQQASHTLRSLAAADGLVDVPPATTRRPGEQVTVLLLD